MRRVSIDKSLSVSPVDGARGLSPSGTNGPESFKMKVPNEFIKKLASMYGSPNDPVIQAMLGKKDGVDTPVPSEIGFEIYQKLIKNAEAKACKEAEEAAKDWNVVIFKLKYWIFSTGTSIFTFYSDLFILLIDY